MNLDYCDKIFTKAMTSQSEPQFLFEIEPLWSNYEILSLGFGRGSIYWRARPIEDNIFKNVSDLKYPPKADTKLGRINEKGRPCFYTATTKETALAEIDAEDGQLIQLAGYRILLNSSLRLALVGEYSNVQKTGYISMTGTDPDRTISKILNGKNISDALRFIYIDKFFASVFADLDATKEDYIKSRALAGAIYSKVQVDGIAFPSVKDKGGFNIALKPEAYKEHLHNVACLVLKIKKRRSFGLIEYEVVKLAQKLNDNMDFCWMPKDSPYEMGVYGMTKEEYEFAMKSPHDKNNLMNATSFYSNHG